jgi:uncharacterized protein (DUF111 family)
MRPVAGGSDRFFDRALTRPGLVAKTAASVLCDEAMHSAMLRQAHGEYPVPKPFVF